MQTLITILDVAVPILVAGIAGAIVTMAIAIMGLGILALAIFTASYRRDSISAMVLAVIPVKLWCAIEPLLWLVSSTLIYAFYM